MSQEWNEWELSKENVQPLRQGRIMSTLQEVLAQQETSSHTAIQQQKQEFESEIRFYSGDDPLDVWDRYIKWTEQTFPQGGKESNLSAVLERAVKALNEQQRYYKDPRYLSLWLKFGNYCSEPLDLYSYLHSQEIGTSLALFYITWAEALEARGSYKKADLIFQEGLQRRAEPQDKLQSHHRQFQARVSRQTLLGLEQDEEELDLPVITETQRSSLVELKGKGKKIVRAPINRVGDALKAANRGRSFQNSSSQQVSNGPNFAVFDENTASVSRAELPILTPQPWTAPPAGRAKENELKAGPWNSGRVRSGKAGWLKEEGGYKSWWFFLVSFKLSLQPTSPLSPTSCLRHRKPALQGIYVPDALKIHMSLRLSPNLSAFYWFQDELHEIEPLTEDAILTGSYKNKTLCPSPEDTCDFVRAAHLASTPFHGVVAQRIQPPTNPESTLKEEYPEPKSTSLSQQIPICEGIYNETLCIKKLSPIMEASQEDTHSSGSSVSSASSLSSVTHISTIKYLHIPEKLELAQSLPVEMASDTGGNEDPTMMWSAEQRRRLLDPLPDSLNNSPGFCSENGPMPVMELEKEIELGNEIYCIKREYWTNEDYKMFFGVLSSFAKLDAKGFAIKVYSQPVPWDFYITLQLQERLSTGFDQSFSENCSCFLYLDGCATLHREINHFTLWDIIHCCKAIPEEVIMLVVYNILDVVQKLHKAEIVHGNLCPEALFLGDRIYDPFAANEITSVLKIVDFSYSLDVRLQPRVSLLNSFPIAQTQYGQQILAKCSLPYQVDLVGIAEIVHLMLFGEHLQVYQEDSLWKISQNFSKTVDSDLWNKFFRRILNANGKSTVPMLRELREEMSGMFNSSVQEWFCGALLKLEHTFNVENFL
uniref:BUB1 N-terminal domain-containing protein n=1 Tax=Chelydra serpentina TaxID=8475 RepID=A0A8C3RMQ8_CHESE